MMETGRIERFIGKRFIGFDVGKIIVLYEIPIRFDDKSYKSNFKRGLQQSFQWSRCPNH